MTNTLDRYRALLTELLFEREAAGGDLSEEEESYYVARLDTLWQSLLPAEQDVIDAELAAPELTVSGEELRLVDCVVAQGSSEMPRKAA